MKKQESLILVFVSVSDSMIVHIRDENHPSKLRIHW
jgi:hypothetical protein